MIYIAYYFIAFFISSFILDRKLALFFILLLSFVFIGFSFPAGGDWIGYFNNYDCIINNRCSSGFIEFEKGYELIVSVVGNLGFQSILIFIAFLNILLINKYARLFENSALAVFFLMCVFLWSMYIEAIRQAIAFSLILYGVHFLYKNSIKKFILLVCVASLFHITALICFVFVIPFVSIRLSRIFSYVMLISSFIFVSMPILILEFIISLLPPTSMVAMKLNIYLISDAYKPQLSIGIGSILDFVLLFLIFYSLRKIKKFNLSANYKFDYVVFTGAILYVSFALFMGKMMPVLTRIGWYGIPFIIILLYVNIGNSVFYRKIPVNKKFHLSAILVFIYFLGQILRPFTYDYSNYGIFQQRMIIQTINELDDASLRIESREKCLALTRLGYGYLCD
ncbi:EpsG family protein [Acinetobacter nosocomialis]|uniref:EpsG family protein n=1 Tax=Acinetobacter nosocomialis TaxID=106654 RepID=UPI0024484932|nr:EpsG family protein [Acinetobacter nosocomialis]MDH2636576.1 EpsG family protein [Acinetobacter nosocomialis]